jgi:hypothetical protein
MLTLPLPDCNFKSYSCKQKSFSSVRGWKRLVEQHGHPQLHNSIVLVGNKCDAIDRRLVSYERGKALADEFGWPFFETSAKRNINVTEAFKTAARMGVSGGCMRAQMRMHATQLHLTLALAFRRVTLFAFAQIATAARAVADRNARAGPTFISGAFGPHAARINGFYVVTEEKSLDGSLVLSKRGDPSVCIEHRSGWWEVKDVSDKGRNLCWACVEGGCALEDCTSRMWRVRDREGGGFEKEDDARSIKMTTTGAAEANAAVVRPF